MSGRTFGLIMGGIVLAVIIGIVWIGAWAVGEDNKFERKCESMGGVVAMNRDTDLCLAPEVVLDKR